MPRLYCKIGKEQHRKVGTCLVKKTVLVIDGQGGKIGKLLVEKIKAAALEVNVIAIGTNSIATANMIKGGAENAATGENPVVAACRYADVILGPIGIVVADALLGEVTPAMAAAVGQSQARLILIPMNKCEIQVAGVNPAPIGEMVERAMALLKDAI